ncbi:hypothetical protein Tco_0972055 [Tanacetum coccineum]
MTPTKAEAQLNQLKRLADLKPAEEKSIKSLEKIMNLVNIQAQTAKMADCKEVEAQLNQLKRLADLKAAEEKSIKSLGKIMNLVNIKAQTAKMAEYEAKRAKMLAEYNHYITFRADQRRITKINYKINRVTKDATMRIERDNQPLSLTVMEKFGLKHLGFSEWIKIQALASKGKIKATDTLLKSLKDKFEWIKTQARKLSLPLPSELTAFGFSAAEKKRKRTSELIKEVFVKENIKRNSPEAEEMYKKLELTIEARNDVNRARIIVRDNLDGGGIPAECKALEGNENPLSAKHQRAMKTNFVQSIIKGLAEGKASASNLRDIQVKDIVKEFEDYLKIYSSTKMDIRWHVEGIL